MVTEEISQYIWRYFNGGARKVFYSILWSSSTDSHMWMPYSGLIIRCDQPKGSHIVGGTIVVDWTTEVNGITVLVSLYMLGETIIGEMGSLYLI